MNMYEVLNRTNCKRNAQQRSTSNASRRNAQRSVCGHGPLGVEPKKYNSWNLCPVISGPNR